jgi:hypothetical protein
MADRRTRRAATPARCEIAGGEDPAAAQTPVVLRMARNAEPGVFIPWLIDDNTALFTMG